MSVTANGWPSYENTVPGPTFVATGEGGAHDVASNDLAVLFGWVVYRWHTEIEPVTACCGGRTYNEQMKANRLAPTSNHVSFTAIDVNGAKHSYEASGNGYHSGFSPAGLATLRAILDESEVLQWGGDFPSPYQDAMHIQVKQSLRPQDLVYGPRLVSAGDVSRAAAKIAGIVKAIQKVVGAVVDGHAGPGMLSAVRAWQKKNGLKDDGIFGPASQAKANPAPKPATPAAKPVTKPAPKPVKKHANLKADGDFGAASVRALEQAAGLHPTGLISSQSNLQDKGLPGISAIQYVAPAHVRGSQVVAWLQRRVGVHDDGILGPGTVRALQQFLRRHGFPKTPVDGVWGKGLSERVQRALNRGVL